MKGMTTNQGMNAIGLLALIYEFGGSRIPDQHHEVFAYVCTVALVVVCWLTKGSHPQDGVALVEPEFHSDKPPAKTIEEILREGRQ